MVLKSPCAIQVERHLHRKTKAGVVFKIRHRCVAQIWAREWRLFSMEWKLAMKQKDGTKMECVYSNKFEERVNLNDNKSRGMLFRHQNAEEDRMKTVGTFKSGEFGDQHFSNKGLRMSLKERSTIQIRIICSSVSIMFRNYGYRNNHAACVYRLGFQ